jgi:hypothetical protein
MFIILPLLSFLITVLIFKKQRPVWRESLILAAICWGLTLTAITEFLNLFKLISFPWLLGAWIFNCIVLTYIYFFRVNKKQFFKSEENDSSQINSLRNSPLIFFLLSSQTMIVAIIGLIAIVAPTNNWDSMDYHMSRVAYWIQHHSIAHYPTSYTPQLYQNPWSAFVILHFQILSGSDYFANLVQWLSMVGCLIGVSLIAKQLGANLHGQVFSSVVTATIPMGILQASSTQNDYVLAFWLVCLAYCVVVIARAGKSSNWNHLLIASSSLGLAMLSKGTAYIYAFPFCIWLGLLQIKRLGWQVYKSALIVGSISLLLNIGHYLRNYNLFASPLGEPGNYKNEVLGINILFSNLLRNLGLHIGTPLGLWNGIANRLIEIIHIIIGVDINDARTTFSQKFFVPGGLSTIGINGNENGAGNLLHLVIIIVCIIIFLARKNIRQNRYITAYLITVIATFLVFCYLLKWQAWNTRLHLAFFVLMSPFVGVILSKIQKRKIVAILMIVLLTSSLPWVFFNRNRPIMANNNIFQTSRIEQYFSNRLYLQDPYQEATDFLKEQKCSHIGLSMGNDPWEYPLWILLQKKNPSDLKIQHINVNNVSAKIENEYPYKNFEPCGVIAMETRKSKQEKRQEIKFKDQNYLRVWGDNQVTVFVKK